ncbi:SOS response-associated peptidase [Neorhodopirellula lusitana]|uniref:SOS response-associated peptidase n=1 Tax=Neorhodopirellula lusitana TaxID=445327 RepID=UPI00384FC873
MCNRFNLKTNLATLTDLFDAMLGQSFETDADVFPGRPTPALAINRDGRRECLPMNFGLVPFGKSPAQQKRPLTNARVENLDKWPWRSSIQSYRCVVPMNGFREPCYWGETAGTEVDFTLTDERPMLAAAIFSWYQDSPLDNDTGSADQAVFSMSLIMRPALPIVMQHGHHRSPFFLAEAGIDEWLAREPRPLQDSLRVLKTNAADPELVATVARQMAPAWKKRQAAHLKKRDEQVEAIQTEGPLGIGDSVV